MTRATLLLGALLGTLSAGAVAQQTMGADTDDGESGTRQTKTFTELDNNSDGILEEDEVQEASFDGSFDDLDSDSDGEVNRNEYYQYYREQSNMNR